MKLGGIEGSATLGASAGSQTKHIHQLIEDDELDGELDGVGQGLGAGLVNPLAAVDFAHEGNIERNAEDVEVDEEFLGLASLSRIVGEQHLQRGANVDDGDDQFLEGEDDELNALVHVVDFREHARIRSIAAKGEDGGRDLEDAEVDDDHDENTAQHLVIAYDQVQP